MTQTTGGRFTWMETSSSSSFKSSAITSIFSSCSQMQLNSNAISSAAAKSISLFTVTIFPCKNSFLIMAEGWTFIRSDNSRIVSFSGMVMVLMVSSSFFGGCWSCWDFLPLPFFSRLSKRSFFLPISSFSWRWLLPLRLSRSRLSLPLASSMDPAGEFWFILWISCSKRFFWPGRPFW